MFLLRILRMELYVCRVQTDMIVFMCLKRLFQQISGEIPLFTLTRSDFIHLKTYSRTKKSSLSNYRFFRKKHTIVALSKNYDVSTIDTRRNYVFTTGTKAIYAFFCNIIDDMCSYYRKRLHSYGFDIKTDTTNYVQNYSPRTTI